MAENEIILLSAAGTFLVILCGALVVSFYVYKNLQLKRVQELLRSEIEIHEQSFENISHEIHDNIGQVLSLAKLNLNAIEEDLPEEKCEKIRKSKDLVGQAIADLRNLSKNLNAALISEIGLNEAIKRELELLSKSAQYETAFEQEGHTFRFDARKELITFRIFQQIVHKAVNRPGLKLLKVQAIYHPHRFSLSVHDDGKAAVKTSRRLWKTDARRAGEDIHTRASLIGAELNTSSGPESGNTTFLTLDVEKNN